MRVVSFDKDRAERLLAAIGRGEPIVVEGQDLFLLAGICYSLLAGGLKGVASPPPPGEHIEHLELEVEQGWRDLLAGVLFVSALVLHLRVGGYDEHFKSRVTVEVELTQEPRYLTRAVWGFRSGGPFGPEAG